MNRRDFTDLTGLTPEQARRRVNGIAIGLFAFAGAVAFAFFLLGAVTLLAGLADHFRW